MQQLKPKRRVADYHSAQRLAQHKHATGAPSAAAQVCMPLRLLSAVKLRRSSVHPTSVMSIA